MRLAGPEVGGGWVVRMSGWRDDGSLGKGEEGWRTTLGAGCWLKRGPDRGLPSG